MNRENLGNSTKLLEIQNLTNVTETYLSYLD